MVVNPDKFKGIVIDKKEQLTPNTKFYLMCPTKIYSWPILFNCFFNDIFYVIETANAHIFAGTNTLTDFTNKI